MNRFHTYLINI
ncbi:hypothetical protein F383_38879 [Gossypium arboreum]|uniref:Uncharacterized protein n=1 Tax=Gossypium arboreum TaxID=29729 RepID=A0A0B0MJ32_GOSAR|nr:hypothetical protein F383_38879 [Gossypium arboreum]